MLEVTEITPRGPGAVSIVRFKGAGACAAVECLCGHPLASGTPHLVRLSIDGDDLDQAIVAVLDENEVEVCLHGSPAIVMQIVQRFGVAADRQRARSLRERAEERLARAPCDSAARILLDQAEGALSGALEDLCALAPTARDEAIDRLTARWAVARRALEPARVVVAGPVNAGKSTLFNALVGRRRTIESDEPGTTRDVIGERALFGAYPVWLLDTAGERALDTRSERTFEVERAGQERARVARESADLVLWLEPATLGAKRVTSVASLPPFVHLASLLDRLDAAASESIANGFSVHADPEGARALVVRLFLRQFDLPENPWHPGTAVPFDARIASDVSALRARTRDATFAERVRQLIAGV
jgi:tRNA U34 5-carboxymethylaminomethyl modifying GTPase MnmE/TrmE